MDSGKSKARVVARRQFLSGLSAVAAGSALVFGNKTRGADTTSEDAGSTAPLPTIRLGEHHVTRLIAGSNPISGYSYMGPALDRHMREYFTPERTFEFLRNCERQGINAHQFSRPDQMAGIFQRLRDQGSKMKFICLHADGSQYASIKQVIQSTQPIAIVHHGGVTDRLFRQGKSSDVHDFVKRVHDGGVLAGVSAHNPDCIERIADEGWRVDFFMTCFYYLTRPAEELAKMPPVVTLQIGYPFFASDPATMTTVIRQVDQPCLGFKILGAGRMCAGDRKVEAAFKFAFEHIKSTDGVIVGMYPRYGDQIGDNARYTREFGTPPGGRQRT